MSLQTYRKKRRFARTPEPQGQVQASVGPLRFVVQKHQASRLHYDFRLELDGTLKSWAVPKGPSLDPNDKRLAMMVEDHPLDYRTFEGTIPAGNYGAGTVMVWDEGTYCPRQTADRAEGQRLLRDGLRKGHLSLVLNGQKLKGEFSLIRVRRGQDNAWLLVKKKDAWASTADITQADQSVASGRRLDEIAGQAARPRRSGKPRTKPARKRQSTRVQNNGAAKINRPKVQPMLATLVKQPFDRPGWLFEVKWDGYRAIAEVDRHGVLLYSRNHRSFEDRFAPIVATLRDLGHEAVLDGEVVVVDAAGKSSFQLLQNYQKTGQGRLHYYVFDLLSLDGQDLRDLPLRRRKELLQSILHGLPNISLSDHVEEHGKAFFEAARKQGLEGIIAKNADSRYHEGQRSPNWVKIKTQRRQEAVIGGFTEPRGSRQNLGALVLGVYEGDELMYIGHTGGGSDQRGLADLRSQLEPLVSKTCPFRQKPTTNAPVHWVSPELVCEVSFQEWTQEGRMRQPIFLGLREDKPAQAVRREQAEALPASAARKPANRKGRRAALPRQVGRKPKGTSVIKGSGGVAEPTLTNLGKVYWPEEGYTKGDLLAYYREIAPIILPYLHDRPESLHRHPNGIDGKSFFQKDVSRQPPPAWVHTVNIGSESGKQEITYLLCQDEPSLLYLANLGCIELNPWNSRVQTLDRPDYLVMDLDPEDIPFSRVIETAQVVRKVLERAALASCCKTSGKRGLHVYVPLAARYADEQVRQFAEILARLVHQELPDSTSLVRSPALRQGRVYLDYLQNRRGQTLAAPYSVRPYPGATVSTPLRWSEVKKGLDPTRFTLKTLPARLQKLGDLWGPVLGSGIDLAAGLQSWGRQDG